MTLFISHTTAAECWRSGIYDHTLGCTLPSSPFRPAGSIQVESLSNLLATDRLQITYQEAFSFGRGQPLKPAKHKPTARRIQIIKGKQLALASDPIHVLLPSKSLANNIRHITCHVCEGSIPRGSFVRLDNTILLCSPEFTFLQMASTITFHELVKLGFELCALYTLHPDGCARYDRILPPTTPLSIAVYLQNHDGAPGVVAARKALRYVVSASGSPMETALAIIFCLPQHQGGFGLPLPFMNYRIEERRSRQAGIGKSYYLCDMYWPKAKLSLEYDSDQEHTGSSRIAEDAQRRNNLTSLGVTSITATREQVMDPEKLNHIAHQIAQMLGIRMRSERGWSLTERGRLFRKLVLADGAEFSGTKTRRFIIHS